MGSFGLRQIEKPATETQPAAESSKQAAKTNRAVETKVATVTTSAAEIKLPVETMKAANRTEEFVLIPKQKEVIEALAKVQVRSTPKAKSKGVVIKEPTSTKPKDLCPEVLKRKGKEIMVESPKKLSRKE